MKLRTAILCAAALVLTACSGGDGGVIGTGFTISGAAQKGPFVIGSEVLLNQLQANGTPSTSTILTEISDDLGNFKFDVTQSGPVLMTADGYHFNEITGKLSQGRLLLKAIYNATSEPDQHAFINILTHLAYKRTLALISQGVVVADAIVQAEGEVVNAFKPVLPVSGVTDFTALNIYNVDERLSNGNAYALALSATIYQYAMLEQQKSPDSSVDALLTNILNNLADDIATNGTITSTTVITELVQATRLLRPDEIRKNLEDRSFDVRAQKLPVANIDLFIDTDGDGIVNAEDPDDDNDGIPDELDASPYVYSEAPVLSKPDVTNTLPSNQEIVFEWTSSEYAKNFEIQVSKNADFSTTVVAQVTTNKTWSATLGVGAYYFRARSQNVHDFWGEWSFPIHLYVGMFTKSYGDSGTEYGTKIIQTSDGGYAVIGSITSIQSHDSAVLLLRLDTVGKVLWRKTFNTAENDSGSNLIQTSDGGFLLAASTRSNVKNALRLIKTDSAGNQEWSTLTEGLAAWDAHVQLLLETDGALIGSAWMSWQTVGTITYPRYTPYLIKIDLKGNALWTYTFDETVVDFEDLTSINRNSTGDIMLIGNYSSGTTSDTTDPFGVRPFFAQLSADRASLSYAFATTNLYGFTNGSAFTSDSNLLLTISNSSASHPLYKVSLAGKILWSYRPSDFKFSSYSSPMTERNGLIVYAGMSYTDNTIIQLILLDKDGNELRTQQYGAFGYSYNYSHMVATDDGGFAVLGSRWRNNRNEILVFKTDAEGNANNASAPVHTALN